MFGNINKDKRTEYAIKRYHKIPSLPKMCEIQNGDRISGNEHFLSMRDTENV